MKRRNQLDRRVDDVPNDRGLEVVHQRSIGQKRNDVFQQGDSSQERRFERLCHVFLAELNEISYVLHVLQRYEMLAVEERDVAEGRIRFHGGNITEYVSLG